jgi:hypothetical protein
MKLLYTDSFHITLNATTTLLPALFAAAVPDIVFYGPGYSSQAELERGIAAFVDRTGPYDGIILGSNFPFFHFGSEERLVKDAMAPQRYMAFSSSFATLIAYYRDVVAALKTLPIKLRFGNLLGMDSYCTTRQHVDALEALDLYIIATDAGFAVPPEKLPAWAWTERHFISKKDKITDEWGAYLRRHAERVLSIHHFIGDNEFFFRGLSERSIRISVPGVAYVMRDRALKALRSHKIKPASKFVFYGFLGANRLRLPVFSRFVPLRMFNVTFQGGLADSRFVYTAPEGSGIAVRKFFEVPAAGATMICVPPPNFAALGFEEGRHYVGAEPEALPDVLLGLERKPELTQSIADAGRRLVFGRHSMSARTRQLADCLAAIDRGDFAGSEWADGEFRVLRNAPMRGTVAG